MSQPAETGKRGYSWAPFAPGHELSTLHGAYSERRLGPLAAEIERRLLAAPDTPPWVGDPSYDAVRQSWAWAVAICVQLRRHLADQEDIAAALSDTAETDEDERRSKGRTTRRTTSRRTQSALDALHKHETRSANLAGQLGLTPKSRAELARDLGAAQFDLARAIAELPREDSAND